MDEKRIDAVENVSASESAKEMRKGATRLGEIVSLRTSNRKVFRMDDGSEQAVFSPVTMANADIPWELDASGKQYCKQIGSLRATFSCNEANHELFSLEKDSCKVTFSAAMNPGQRRTGIVPTLRHADGMDNTFLFENVADSTDMEYSVVSGGVKENILVKQQADCYRYPFSINCENVSISPDSTAKQIKFISNESGEEVFFIPAPFMVDANGEVSANVHYEMETPENGITTLTIVADSTWINDPNRVFPVTIDPQINVSGNSGIDTYSWSDGTMTAPAEHIIGRVAITDPDTGAASCSTNRMYLHFNLPSLPNNPRIKKAELVLCQNSASNETNTIPKLGLFQITEDISVGSVTPSQSTRLIDFEPMKAASEDDTVVTYAFDITRIFDEAVNDGASYQNLVLQMMDETALCNSYVALAGDTASANTPYICVTYESSYGVNSSYPSHSHTIGPGCQGSVDLATGNLMFEVEDFTWAGNRMPITLRHLYTSALGTKKFTNNAADLLTADFSDMKLGFGWKLNLMQSIRAYVFVHEGSRVFGYVHVDENGNTVYFKAQSSDSDIFEAVDGSDMVYDRSTRILTQGDTKYLFDNNGKMIQISDDCNTTQLTYTGTQLTAITDSVGRVFTFTYDANSHLTSIIAPDGSQVVYGYSGDLLTSITYPNGRKTTLTYANSLPSSVSILDSNNTSLYKVCYTFSGDRVSSVSEFGENNAEGKYSNYEYSAAGRWTKVNSMEQAEEDGAEDQVITTVYAFDKDGQIQSQYAYAQGTEKIGINGIGSGIHPYFSEDGIPTVNMSTNLLTHHSFEDITSWNTSDWNATGWAPIGDVSCRCLFNPSCSRFGKHFIHLAATNSESLEAGVYQTRSGLSAGTYTFSAYLRPLSTEENSSTKGAYLRVTDSSGNVLAESERLTGYDTDYVRMAVTFDLTATTDVRVMILMSGEGRMLVDTAQLEANPYATAYNILENGHFDTSGEGWQHTEGAQFDADTFFRGSRSIKISGDLNSPRNTRQGVIVKPTRSDRETFTLSGWAKGFALPVRERDDCPDSQFRLRAVIHYDDSEYDDTSTETFTADFSPCTDDWQYTSIQFCKSKYRTVSHIEVFCDFDYNCGTVYFDDIQLVRDSLETELSAEDFSFADVEVDTDDETQTTTDAVEDDTENPYTAPTFEELKDEFGNALTETTFTDGEFGTIYRSLGYDEQGNNLIRETDARGNMTTYAVDPVTSRNQSITDRCGNQTAYEYDAAGRTTKMTSKDSQNAELAYVSYTYDSFDNLTAITRGDGMKYALQYNAFHNLESIGIQDKAEKLVNYTYKNGNGRLKEISYANGDTMKATYNAMGQMVAEQWFNSDGTLTASYRYSYDGQGNIVRSVDILCQKEYHYTYEEGRITRAVESDVTLDENQMVTGKTIVHTLRYIYDQEGNLLRKHSIAADGTEQICYCETDGNDNTVVKVQSGDHTYTSHSKNDSFGRKEFDEIQTGYGCISRQFLYHVGQKTEEHLDNGKVKSTPTTNLVKQIILFDGHTISYEYDEEERITKVIDTVYGTTEYTYDAQGQLLTETVNGTRVNTMTYDAYGNILTKNGKTYTYGDTTWKDKLTAVGDETISYDAQGNPTTYLGHTLTWEKGRQLKSFDGNTYTYNANGIRTSKTVNGVKHTYTLDGTKVLRETWGDNVLIPLYDNEESVCGVVYNGTPYYFQRNLQGDVTSICTRSGAILADYAYDAWGACRITYSDPRSDIASVNPFRYRGYYYDTEIGIYYLQSRYYDPAVGRFVNKDTLTFLYNGGCVLDCNISCYCNNSPTNRVDPFGFYYTPVVAFYSAFGIVWTMSNRQLRQYRLSSTSKVISVISCSPLEWVKTSKTMGTSMARAMMASGTCSIECPTDYLQFKESWRYAGKCVIIHTHGDPSGLYNEKGGTSPTIIPVSQIKKIERNRNIKFVMMTACSTAGGDKNNNVAYWLSKKINSSGIVIANKYIVSGNDSSFKAYNSKKGWVVYRNGKIIRSSDTLPVSITMKGAYKIYKSLT